MNVRRVSDYLEKNINDHEIILVDDGSTDGTHQVLEDLKSNRIKVIILPNNKGKFGAIRAGIDSAVGECVIFTDADLPFELEAFKHIFHNVKERGVHIVIGDRTLVDSEYVGSLSLARTVATVSFSLLIRMLVTGGLFDTQCGLKGFRLDVAKALSALMHEERFAGDVEMLYIALKYNLEIKRIPVRLVHNSESTVRLGWDSLLMLRRLLLLPLGWRMGWYRSAALSSISSQRYWEQVV
jgi:dolichyl-phosphate beta-glucosyltransferase